MIMWYEADDNVTTLGSWLLENEDFDAKQLQAYYEKPWKWSDKFNEMTDTK